MKNRKLRDQRAAVDKQRVLEELNNHPDGILSEELSELTGIPQRLLIRYLISLRNSDEVFSIELDSNIRIHAWTLNPTPPKSNFDPLYPNFDAEHQEWMKKVSQPKPNPWGHECH